MKWKSVYQHPQRWTFEIELDEFVGYYLFVYDGGGDCPFDHLQDTLAIARQQALKDYGVPLDSWVQVE